MKLSILIIILAVTAAPKSLFAKETPFQIENPRFFIESCKEAVDIFSSQEDIGYLAAYRTSLSEAMRAGYCIGVLEQFSDSVGKFCGVKSGWFEQASLIASLDLTPQDAKLVDTRDLLRAYICEN